MCLCVCVRVCMCVCVCVSDLSLYLSLSTSPSLPLPLDLSLPPPLSLPLGLVPPHHTHVNCDGRFCHTAAWNRGDLRFPRGECEAFRARVLHCIQEHTCIEALLQQTIEFSSQKRTHMCSPATVRTMLEATVRRVCSTISPEVSFTEKALEPCTRRYERGSAPASAVALTLPSRVPACAARGIVSVSDGLCTVGKVDSPAGRNDRTTMKKKVRHASGSADAEAAQRCTAHVSS